MARGPLSEEHARHAPAADGAADHCDADQSDADQSGADQSRADRGAADRAAADKRSGPAEPCALTPQEAKSARTRAAIHAAAVACLDDHGYAETSVLKVQSLAGVSRGALTHQYPTKIEMIAAVAEQLLDDVRHTPSPHARPKPDGDDGYVEWLLMFAWDRFIHTRDGRALTEIFRATRTDAALAERLAEPIAAWTASIDAWFLRRLTAEGGEVEVRALVRLFRALTNGLAFDAGATDADQEHLVCALARLIAPRLRRRRDGGYRRVSAGDPVFEDAVSGAETPRAAE